MSNELVVDQLSVEGAIAEAARGQTSDRQDLVDRIHEAVEKNLPKNKSFLYKAPSFDEFFVETDYYYILSLWLSIESSLTGSSLYRRLLYSGEKFFQVDFEIKRDEIVLKNSSYYTIFVFNPLDLYVMGYKYIRDCVYKTAELILDEGHVFPEEVDALFPSTFAKAFDDLKDIQNKSFDLVARLGDLRIYDYSIRQCGYKNIYDFCKVMLGIGRTSVKNMLEIYDKFFDHCCLKNNFADYSYSQLVELCSVDIKDLDKFDESMTIREIKAKKKELRESSGSKVDENFVVSGVDKDNDGSFSSEEAECESDGEAGGNDVHALGFQAAIDAVKEMQNPYYVSGKEKQSARYDAYQNALHDVLEKLDEILSESLKCVVLPERHDNDVLLHGVVVGNPEA